MSRKGDGVFEHCTWLNEPAQWRLDGSTLHVRTDLKTDFWRETHYGFVRHNGHEFGYRTTGDFTASVRVRGAFRDLYDQAGIMVLLDDRTWIKAGIVSRRADVLLAGTRRPGGRFLRLRGDPAHRQGAARPDPTRRALTSCVHSATVGRDFRGA